MEKEKTILVSFIYLQSNGVDNWSGYCDAINDGIEEWLYEHQDFVNTWDDDDPRYEDFYIDDIAQMEIDMYYKKFLLEEKDD